jgi:preprotein translocase subunit SecA
MSIVNSILGKLFGSKSERDIKEISPIVESIKKSTVPYKIFPTMS